MAGCIMATGLQPLKIAKKEIRKGLLHAMLEQLSLSIDDIK